MQNLANIIWLVGLVERVLWQILDFQYWSRADAVGDEDSFSCLIDSSYSADVQACSPTFSTHRRLGGQRTTLHSGAGFSSALWLHVDP